MPRPRRPLLPALGLVAWTAFVWLTRVRNVLGDDELSVAARTTGLLLAISFLVLAALVLLTALRRRDRLAVAILALAGWTVVVWIVRGIGIATGDHSEGFIVVHLALGAISIALAAVATRSVVQVRDGFSAATTGR